MEDLMRNVILACAMCVLLTGCGAVNTVDKTLHCIPPATGGCPL